LKDHAAPSSGLKYARKVVTQSHGNGRGNGAKSGPIGTANRKVSLFRVTVLYFITGRKMEYWGKNDRF
jgi:hypothetical protein